MPNQRYLFTIIKTDHFVAKKTTFIFLPGESKQGCRRVGLCSDCDPFTLCVEPNFRLLRKFCACEKFETPPYAERVVRNTTLPISLIKAFILEWTYGRTGGQIDGRTDRIDHYFIPQKEQVAA